MISGIRDRITTTSGDKIIIGSPITIRYSLLLNPWR